MQDRTNNLAEAAHRRLKVELGMGHPSLWKLIDCLKRVQKGRDLEYEKLIAGHSPPAKRRKYQAMDARIFKPVQQFSGNSPNFPPQTMLEFLRGIAHNLEMHQ